ncbi:MAG: hypothetical protein ACI85Q_000604 [Salibacteraceae bacterium]|jgi:hypothetical protein
MKIKAGLVGAVVSTILMVSCNTEPEVQSEDIAVETEQENVVKVEETEEFVLPSTLQIGDLFRNSGLQYVSGLTLDPNKSTTYNTTFDKYFAFGAYWTDMTYCVLNQQSQEARKYMKVVKEVSTELGAGEVFSDQDILNRFDKNLENNDSILMILIEIDEKTDAYLDDNDQDEFAIVSFVGGWVEGMYLGVSTSTYEGHTQLTGRIIEQMVILDQLVVGLSKYEGSSKKVDNVLADMKGMQTFFNEIPAIADLEGSISDVRIPSADMKVLGNKILALRALIVE